MTLTCEQCWTNQILFFLFIFGSYSVFRHHSWGTYVVPGITQVGCVQGMCLICCLISLLTLQLHPLSPDLSLVSSVRLTFSILVGHSLHYFTAYIYLFLLLWICTYLLKFKTNCSLLGHESPALLHEERLYILYLGGCLGLGSYKEICLDS